VADGLGALLLLPELLLLPDVEGLEPLLREAVGEEEAESASSSRLPLLLLEGEELLVGVGERVLLPVPVTEAEREEEKLPLGVPVGVTEALAQRDKEAVGEALRLLLQLSLLLGLPEGVALLVGVSVPVEEAVGLWLLLRLLEEEPLGLTEGLAPTLRLPVGEAEREALRLALLEGVGAALPLPL
jgi:hypothetical protein